MNKRLKQLMEKECRFQFAKCFHIADSQIVHAMVQKETYRFNTFAATRVGEIQDGTNPENWYLIASEQNIADWLRRGNRPDEIDCDSPWQKGPNFLKLSESEWPVSRECNVQELLQQVGVVMMAEIKTEDFLAARIDSSKHSSYVKLIRVTERVLSMFQKNQMLSLRNVAKALTPTVITKAEKFWILEVQKSVKRDLESGKFRRMCPKI